jgi:hypothetical protein
MRKDGTEIQRAGWQSGRKHAEHIYELMAVHIDSDLEAAAFFAPLSL